MFARPLRERDPRVASYMRLMEACLTVLEMEEAREQPSAIEQVYMPVVPALFRVPDALARIRTTLAGLYRPINLTGLLPRMPEVVTDRELVARSAVSSTLVAALELARTGELVLGDEGDFEHVNVAPIVADELVGGRG